MRARLIIGEGESEIMAVANESRAARQRQDYIDGVIGGTALRGTKQDCGQQNHGLGQARSASKSACGSRQDTGRKLYDFSATSFNVSAMRLSSGSDRSLSFRMRLLRCTLTVASEIPMSPAICLLSRPRAT